MTRETKIGLLVGLAFIIVIGILLSDHINTTSDPMRAQLTGAYDNVTNSVNAPGTDHQDQRSTAVVLPNRVEPPIPVQTQRETRQPGPGATIVHIEPGSDPSQMRLSQNGAREPLAHDPPSDPNVRIVPPDNNGNDSNGTDNQVASANPNNSGIPGNLESTSRKYNEPLVPVNPQSGDPVGIHTGGPDAPSAGAPRGQVRPALPPGFREIKAEPNDSVSRLAAKYLGTSNKSTREAIIRANPSLQAEPHLVIVGKTYVIPPFGVAVNLPAAGQQTPAAPQPQRPVVQQPKPAAPQPGVNYYTVKENDNLWKIAADQLGSGTRWTEIRDLNKDVLKGGDGLQLNMRLKLPPKRVASSN